MSLKVSSTTTVLSIIAVTALTRVLHVVPNMAPVTALAVFGAWAFRDAKLAYIVPILAMIAGDAGLAIVTGDVSYAIHDTQLVVYACLLATTWISLRLKNNETHTRRALSVLSGSVLFFLVTNFAVWLTSGMYEVSLSGLGQCFTLALPFFRNSLVSDVVYSALMFGALELAIRSGVSPIRVKQ